MSSLKNFIPSGETFTSRFDARVAAHDYAHEGYYFRVLRSGDQLWEVWVAWGREVLPACCRNKRTYVDEPSKQLWEPRSSKSLRRKTGKLRSA